MNQPVIVKKAHVVNEGNIFISDVLIENGKIKSIGRDININNVKVITAEGKYLIPGIIDDQVHFREPGLTHKADIYTESKAAVAGGVTSFMEMPTPFQIRLHKSCSKKNILLPRKNL